MPDYEYIDTQDALDRAVGTIQKSSYLALDTESSSFYTYFNELCLLQFSCENLHGIIDPLAGLNLSSLGAVMENPDIEKIFHAAASDIVELKRDLGWKFVNVFDTFLACKYLGLESCSLSALAHFYCGVTLEKGEQKSNWKQRPLTQSQLDYAHLDTLYLSAIRDHMHPELKRQGLEEEYYQEIEFQVASLSSDTKEKDPDAYAKVNGVQKLSAPERGRFKAIHEIREQEAAAQNIAPFRLMNNHEMIRMARNVPEKAADLKRFKAHPRFFSRRGQDLIEALSAAEPIEKNRMPSPTAFEPGTEELFKTMKSWRSRVAEKRNLESGMILNNRVLKEIARQKPASLDQLKSLQLMTDWKTENYGPDLLKMIQSADGNGPEK
ncbi:MAG: hypothetical protein CMN76_14820 [Spirochaetaceae bacterium]|nr:hypothetical protein [Spirochaetaceae bacterium]